MSVVNYTEAKQIIKDGDIVFVHGVPTDIVQALIMFFTGSRFSHCFIAFHVEICGTETVMCVEAQGHTRRRVIPFSLYDDHVFTIVAAPKHWNDVKDTALRDVGIAKYNMLRAIYIGIREYCIRRFQIELPPFPRTNEVCSDFCGDVYGIENQGSPQSLYNNLMDITFER